MKNLMKYVCMMLVALCPAAGLAQIGSAQAQVNIIIAQAQSITIAQPTVNINMATEAQYLTGSTSGQQANHVQITSTTGYQVNVKTTTQFFSLNGTTTTLPVSTIAVQTSVGSDLSGTGATVPSGIQVASQAMLSTSAATIISCPAGEAARGFNVNYAIPANQTTNYLNRDAGAYSTTVVYTLTPQ